MLPPDRHGRPSCGRSAWCIEAASAPPTARWRRRAGPGSRAAPHAAGACRVPVVSVGNLSVGGSGKTPAVAALARLLLAAGARPGDSQPRLRAPRAGGRRARGERRRVVFEPVERSGDEPQLLARTLPGVPVLVCPGSLSGRRARRAALRRHGGPARRRLSAPASSRATSTCCWCGPRICATSCCRAAGCASRSSAGRARPTPSSCRARSARRRTVAAMSARAPVFTLGQEFATPRLVRPFGDAVPEGAFGTSRRLVAVAGIARPERFFATSRRSAGRWRSRWSFATTTGSRGRTWQRFTTAVQTLGAGGVITTEKDAVRLTSLALPARHRVDLRPDARHHRAGARVHGLVHGAPRRGAAARLRARPARPLMASARARRRTVSGRGGARARGRRRACRSCRCRPCARAAHGFGPVHVLGGRLSPPHRAREPGARVSRRARPPSAARWPRRCSRTSAACCSSC